MYSIVMMAAMTAGPETPEFGCFKKNYGGGCYGCAGYGDPYGGYGYGYGCGGYGGGNKCCFCGGGFLGLGLWNKFKGGSGYGCGGYGDAYGYGYGGGYGCAGYGGGNKCCFCGGGFLGLGLLHKKGGYGCGGYGYPAGPAAPAGNAYYGPPMGYDSYAYGPPAPAYGPPQGGYGYQAAYAPAQPQAAPAQVVVKVPADAKVYANGQLTDLAGTERVFATPEITTGQDFRYVIEVEANGAKTTKQIVVRAGHQTVVDFAERVASPVVVNLPEKAKLTVDGVAAPAASGKATFLTPELTKGQVYSYQFQVEVEEAGKVQVVTQKVRFKAGEPVSVDFVGAATALAK